jgi:polyphosphate kinase
LSQNVFYRGLRLWFGRKHLAVASTDLKLPNYYINRKLSQLEFCRRVLFMARDGGLPMLERLRYLCIASGILDEFFEIRVAGPKQQAD